MKIVNILGQNLGIFIRVPAFYFLQNMEPFELHDNNTELTQFHETDIRIYQKQTNKKLHGWPVSRRYFGAQRYMLIHANT